MSERNYLSQSSVQEFLTARKRSSTFIATGVMLCIFFTDHFIAFN